jgi:hypothetical protein
LEAFEAALMVPSVKFEQHGDTVRMIHQLKAKAEALGAAASGQNFNSCLKSVEKALEREPGPDLGPVLSYFDHIVSIMANGKHWKSLDELLQKVSMIQFAASFLPQTYETLHSAVMARRTEDSMTHLNSMYKDAIEVLAANSLHLQENSLRVWWAIFKRHVQSNTLGAIKLLQDVLQGGGGAIHIDSIVSGSWQLAEIFLEQLYDAELNSTEIDVTQMLTDKHKICDSIEQLLQTINDKIPEFHQDLSPLSIILALMRKSLGPIRV